MAKWLCANVSSESSAFIISALAYAAFTAATCVDVPKIVDS